MKNSLLVPVVFVISFLLVSFAGSIFYMAFYNTCFFVAGTATTINFADLFVRSLFLSMPVACAAACLFMIFYLIRHPKHNALAFVFYFVISICVWAFLLPVLVKEDAKIKVQFPLPEKTSELSSGYFRKTDDEIVYYSKDYVLNLGLHQKDENLEHDVLPVEEEFVTEPLIRRSLKVTPFINFIIETFLKLKIIIASLISSGLSGYFAFLTAACAMIALISLKRASSWKLLNVAIILTFASIIILINVYFVFSDRMLEIQKYLVQKKIALAQYKLFFPVLINGLITLGLSLFGIIRAAYLNAKKIGGAR